MFAPNGSNDWPDADHRSRLVFVVHDLVPEEILERFAFAAPSIIGSRTSSSHHPHL